MPLTGVHVACSFVGDDARLDGGAAIRSKTKLSDGPASNTPTNFAAPADASGSSAVFNISTGDAAVYYAIGPNPNPAASPRDYLKANDQIDRYVEPGDKLAWIAA